MHRSWVARVDPDAQLVGIPVELVGPNGRATQVTLIVDTGSPCTILRADLAESIDLTAAVGSSLSRLLGPAGAQDGFVASAAAISLMGATLKDFPVHCHDLEPELEVDGVVGLDILRNGELRLDMAMGLIQFDWHAPRSG